MHTLVPTKQVGGLAGEMMISLPSQRGSMQALASEPPGDETAGVRDDAPRGRLSDPLSLFKVSVPPARCVSSAGSGWDGAFFAEVTAAPAGEFGQVHDVVMIHRWLTPLRIRPVAGPAGWTTHAPAVWLRFPGDAQFGEWRGSVQSQFLFLTPERVEAVLGKSWDRTGLTRWRDPCLHLQFASSVLSAMKQDVDTGHPAGPLTGDSLVVALLAYLDGRGAAASSPGPDALGRRLDLVREYIDANLARPLRLAELATLAGVGVRRFGTIFAAETGWSPHRYVLHRRVERAKVLMRDPELTLSQVGRAVGFSGESQFGRVFRQFVGEAPRTYRRR